MPKQDSYCYISLSTTIQDKCEFNNYDRWIGYALGHNVNYSLDETNHSEKLKIGRLRFP